MCAHIYVCIHAKLWVKWIWMRDIIFIVRCRQIIYVVPLFVPTFNNISGEELQQVTSHHDVRNASSLVKTILPPTTCTKAAAKATHLSIEASKVK